jgi:hypothetical protein
MKGRLKVKPIKMLGLAALAALMAMAIAGASSAMAESTSLCAADEAECATPLTHVHETTLTGHKAVLKTSLLTVECDVLFLGDALSESGAPLVIHGTFTYTNCGGCTATEENGPAEIKVLKEGHETGSVVGEGLVHVECSGLNCRYNGVGLKGTAKGPLLSTETNGEVSLVKQSTNKEGGLFCPSTSELTITTTPLSATYITLGPMDCVEIKTGESAKFLAKNGTKCEEEDLVTQKKEEGVKGHEHIFRLVE